ncbi:MAG: molybdopterin-binding protein [Candidatus Bathyarchaeia archaeon]
MTANVEIISIGNELLIGKIQNTNAYWLSQQITALGANVQRETTIPDIITEIAQTIREAAARKPQFIITIGGLGPTFDDKTLQGLAKALNQDVAVNPQALEMVREKCVEYAKKRGMPAEVEMTPPRIKMAMLPQNAEPIANPIGTAPAARAEIDGAVLFTLPGVPVEMEAIFTQTIAPLIRTAVGSRVFCQHSIFAEGIFESRLAPLIDRVMKDNLGVYVKSHPLRSEDKLGIEVHLTMTACQEQQPALTLRRAADQLNKLIVENGGVIHL